MEIDLSGLESLFIGLIDRVTDDPSMYVTRSREGIFSPALTMWLMINGWAKGRRGVSSALEAIGAGEASGVIARNSRTKRVQVTPLSTNSGGLTKARYRLRMNELKELCVRINEVLISEIVKEQLWNGQRVYLFDGTTIALTREEELLKKFKPVRNQHREGYTPNILCGVCHELFSGIALNPRHGAYRGQERTDEIRLCCDMLKDLPAKSLVVADRGLGVLPVAYMATKLGHDVLIRLSIARAKGLVGKLLGKHEYIDETLSWKLRETRLKELEIPPDTEVPGRFIKWTVKRDGFKPLELFFFTTSLAPAEEIAALYLQRERIENDIRTLKYTIGMERLYSKTPEMIAQELLLGVLAYNLIRAIIAQAAYELEIPARQISFTRAARYAQVYGNRVRDAKNAEERKKFRDLFLLALRQTKLPNRKKRRVEPRKLARGPQPYPPMKESRKKEQNNAREILEANGHRGYFTSVTRNF